MKQLYSYVIPKLPYLSKIIDSTIFDKLPYLSKIVESIIFLLFLATALIIHLLYKI